MPAKFDRQGLCFQYPENWVVTPEGYESGWSVTVQSPGTAFLTLTLDESGPGIGALADAALAALRAEYKNLDAEPVSGTVAGLPAVGFDVEFFSFDLTNSCQIRSLAAGQGTLLVLAQANDLEETNWAVLRAMIASLQVEERDEL